MHVKMWPSTVTQTPRIARTPQQTYNGNAVHFWQHPIQDHAIKLATAQLQDTVLWICTPRDVPIQLGQRPLNKRGRFTVVFDEHDIHVAVSSEWRIRGLAVAAK